MGGLTRQQIEVYDRRRRRVPLLFFLFPLLTLPVFLVVLFGVGFSLEWLGLEPGPSFGIAALLLSGWSILTLVLARAKRRSRCPSCGIDLEVPRLFVTPSARCVACHQALTPAAFDDAHAEGGPPARKSHRANDDRVKAFRQSLVRARRIFRCCIAALLGGFAAIPLAFPALSEAGWFYAVFAIAGFAVVIWSKVYSHAVACPHCQKDIAHRGTMFPFVLPGTCASCNQPLVPAAEEV